MGIIGDDQNFSAGASIIAAASYSGQGVPFPRTTKARRKISDPKITESQAITLRGARVVGTADSLRARRNFRDTPVIHDSW